MIGLEPTSQYVDDIGTMISDIDYKKALRDVNKYIA